MASFQPISGLSTGVFDYVQASDVAADTLTVSQSIVDQGTLSVTGNTQLTGTLNVTGAAAVHGAAVMAGGLTVSAGINNSGYQIHNVANAALSTDVPNLGQVTTLATYSGDGTTITIAAVPVANTISIANPITSAITMQDELTVTAATNQLLLHDTTINAPSSSAVTLTLPSATDQLVGRATTDTLSNKSMSGSSNTFTDISLTSAVTDVLPIANGGTNSATALSNGKVMVSSGGQIVEGTSSTTPSFTSATLTASSNQLLLNDTTLTAPSSSAVTVTLPSSTDTLVGRGTTDTLTNKSMSGSSNTFTDISLTSAVTGTLPVSNGGTNSNSPLSNGYVMVSSGGKIIEGSATGGELNGQLNMNSNKITGVANGSNPNDAVNYSQLTSIYSGDGATIQVSGDTISLLNPITSSVNNNGPYYCNADTSTGGSVHLSMRTSSETQRWNMGLDGTGSTGDAGYDLYFWKYHDDGSYAGNPLNVVRSTGVVNCNLGLTTSGGEVDINNSGSYAVNIAAGSNSGILSLGNTGNNYTQIAGTKVGMGVASGNTLHVCDSYWVGDSVSQNISIGNNNASSSVSVYPPFKYNCADTALYPVGNSYRNKIWTGWVIYDVYNNSFIASDGSAWTAILPVDGSVVLYFPVTFSQVPCVVATPIYTINPSVALSVAARINGGAYAFNTTQVNVETFNTGTGGVVSVDENSKAIQVCVQVMGYIS